MQKISQTLNIIKKANFAKIAIAFAFAVALFIAPANSIAGSLNNNLSTNLLAAANKSATSYPTDDKNVDGLLYSDSKAKSLDSVDDVVSPATQKKLLDPTQIPAQKQPILDRSDPNAKLLEKTGQMFDDAADFSGN